MSLKQRQIDLPDAIIFKLCQTELVHKLALKLTPYKLNRNLGIFFQPVVNLFAT